MRNLQWLKIKEILGNYIFHLLLYAVFLLYALLPYYHDGCLLLGGEGNFILDFTIYSKKSHFAWVSSYGYAMANTSINPVGLNCLLLCLIEKLFSNPAIPNFALVFSIYFLPFFAMYIACKEIKATPFVCFFCSFSYVNNPFMLQYLLNLNQWCVFSVAIMPLYLWLIIKYYKSNFKLFLFSGCLSVCFSFSFANPPTIVIIYISIIISTIIASYCSTNRFLVIESIRKVSILYLSFSLFNIWWILNIFETLSDTLKKYPHSLTQSFLDTSSFLNRALFAKMYSSTISETPYVFFIDLYSNALARLIMLTPIFIIVSDMLFIGNKKTNNFLKCILLGMLSIVLFLVKGNANPFGFVFNFLFKNIPLFTMFKSSVEKFGIMYIFIFFVLLLFTLRDIKYGNTHKVVLTGICIAYSVFCSIPLVTRNIIPDCKIGNNAYASRKYKDKPEYKQLRTEVNKDSLEYRIFCLPGSANYQVCLENYKNKYYTGMNPVFMNTKKAFIEPYLNSNFPLYATISSINHKKYLGIYNIGKVVINDDMVPWFGFVEKESVGELKRIFNKFMPSETFGAITLYDNKDYFLPHIYAAAHY